ncbi:spore germination lipoprotein GerD [Paenibacillus protaetiae]|uniref:Spore gernimation protein n=1 Tax=Paenibacillus protaetiae TaxID=2509456 RepID=A0A4P6EZZ3_9BACL|nr:spore germination lipoprotein GerD [Paenibacillus protaetiae]QAY67893.1 spore gernimation protein [Paenibacillus protaetiae]
MRHRYILIAAAAAWLLMLAGCGSEPAPNNQQVSYKDLKSMVIDILKTEDAQKALQESSQQMSGYSGGNAKLLSVQDQEQVRLAVKDVLVSPDYDKVIRSLMTDTRFAGEFAKAVNKQNKDIHKQLLKDPSYQADLVKTLNTPDMKKMILEVLQGSDYRKQVMSIMQESMSNPIFKLEMLDLMKSAVKEQLEPKAEDKKKEGGGEDKKDSGGSEGEGEGEGDGEGNEQEG